MTKKYLARIYDRRLNPSSQSTNQQNEAVRKIQERRQEQMLIEQLQRQLTEARQEADRYRRRVRELETQLRESRK